MVSRRRRLLIALACTMLLGTAIGAAVAANSARFEDPTGDNDPAAPDISTVEVGNDDAGILAFRITLPNREDLGEREFVAVYVDLDRDRRTGCDLGVMGADYNLGVFGHADPRLDFASRNKASRECHVVETTQPSSLSTSFDKAARTLTVSIDRCDLRKATSFYFLVATSVPGVPVGDFAANSGRWSYDVVAPDVPCDNTPPTARALPSSGKHGKSAKLRYRVYDDHASTREIIRIYRGAKRIATLRTRLGNVTRGRTYFVSWPVPRRVTGRLRFCVTAWDEWKNRSRPSCAPLRIS